MNMQALMKEAQKMQKQLLTTQKELEETIYEGKSEKVLIKINGKYEIQSIKLSEIDEILNEDKEILEDMIIIAFNDAIKKLNADKEKKLSKYGNGLSGLL